MQIRNWSVIACKKTYSHIKKIVCISTLEITVTLTLKKKKRKKHIFYKGRFYSALFALHHSIAIAPYPPLNHQTMTTSDLLSLLPTSNRTSLVSPPLRNLIEYLHEQLIAAILRTSPFTPTPWIWHLAWCSMSFSTSSPIIRGTFLILDGLSSCDTSRPLPEIHLSCSEHIVRTKNHEMVLHIFLRIKIFKQNPSRLWCYSNFFIFLFQQRERKI